MKAVPVLYRSSAPAIRLRISRCVPLALLVALALPSRAQIAAELPHAPSALGASTLPDQPQTAQTSAAQTPVVQVPAEQAEAQRPGMGQIGGIVTDIQGALVPGARVELEDKATKTRRSATAGSDGRFSFANVAPAEYVVYIDAPGLQHFVSPAIQLKADQSFELPDIALPVSSEQAVDVYFTQKEIAQQELRAEEKQRVLGVIPNFYTSYLWDAAPLDAQQKFELSAHASLDPVGLGIVVIRAGIQQANNTFPSLDPGPAGFGERFAIDFGNHVIGSMIGRALLPSVFHEDPRYFYMGPNSPGRKRVLHALGSSFICRRDRTTRDGFCYSHVLGLFAAAAISNAYTPDRNWETHTFTEWGVGLGGNAAGNLVREFVVKTIAAHVPRYGHGKSAQEPDAHSVGLLHPEGKEEK